MNAPRCLSGLARWFSSTARVMGGIEIEVECRHEAGVPSTKYHGVILPGQQRSAPRVSLLVDTTGSVDDELLAPALAEVAAVIAVLRAPVV